MYSIFYTRIIELCFKITRVEGTTKIYPDIIIIIIIIIILYFLFYFFLLFLFSPLVVKIPGVKNKDKKIN